MRTFTKTETNENGEEIEVEYKKREQSFGYCQLNKNWHADFINSAEFQDEYKQIDYCLGVYNDAVSRGRIKTTFYGYNNRERVSHLLTFNQN